MLPNGYRFRSPTAYALTEEAGDAIEDTFLAL